MYFQVVLLIFSAHIINTLQKLTVLIRKFETLYRKINIDFIAVFSLITFRYFSSVQNANRFIYECDNVFIYLHRVIVICGVFLGLTQTNNNYQSVSRC